MKQHMCVEIDRPIDEVFDYTTNHIAEWSLTVVEDEVIEQKPEVVGSTFRCVTEDHGQRMEFHGEVTRHEPPKVSVVHLTGQAFDIDAEYQFEDLGGRTRVTQHSTVSPKGFLKIMFFLFGWMMKKSSCRALEDELNNLKCLLEDGAAQMPSQQ